MVALALLGLIVAPASADDGADVPGQPYPLSEVEESAGGGQGFLSQLIDSKASEQLPHSDLSRDEAGGLAESVFGGLLEQAAGPFADLEVEKFLSDNAALISPNSSEDLPGVTIGGERAADEEAAGAKGPLLLDSTLPLRAENSAGEEEKIDLDLERSEGELQAVNPLIEVGIPEELSEGVSIPSGSLELDTSASAGERSPSILGGNVAFYPNIAKDTDFAVAPTPTGVETFTQIRSADAPQSQTLELDLEEGAQLEPSSDGGAVATRNGVEVLRVMPPSAVAADGGSVPVNLEVSGDSITLGLTTNAETSYPVLLDPVIVESWAWNEFNATTGMDEGNGAGVGNWRSWRNTLAYGANNRVPWASPPSPLTYNLAGLTMTSGWQSSVEVGAQANWNYYVPRYFTDYEKTGLRPTSFIQNMQMWNLQYATYSSQASPWMAAGLWDEKLNKWVSLYSRNGFEGSITGKYWGQIYNFPNPEYIQSVKNAGAALLSSEAGANNARIFYIGYAAVSLNDLTNPSIAEFYGPEKWVNGLSEPLVVVASDSGLGAKKVVLEYQNQSGQTVSSSSALACVGSAASACPRSQKFELKNYEPSTMPQGTDYVKVTAEDVVGNKSSAALVPVRVDHTAPSLTLSGTMTQQASLGYKRPQYVLHLEGSDGTSGAPQAGIASSEVTVDGKVVDSTKAGCATQNCTLSRDWTLKSEAYTGEHKVVASVTDGAGITTTKSLTIKIEKDTTAPTLETGGTLVTAPEGWVEQVSRSATAYAEDGNGYGVTSLTFSIDSKVIKSVTGTCEAGGCERSLSASVNMAGYAAGAHSAEIVAKDGAGNVSKKVWTINVNPSGTVPSSEAAKTLEASDATSGATTVAPTTEVVEPAELEEGDNPSLVVEGSNLKSEGTAVESSLTVDAGNGYTVNGGEESFRIEPTQSSASETNIEVKNGVAGVAANTTGGVDTVIRPLYDGIQTFQDIRQTTAPETYSWKVQLHSGQSLKAIDETHVGIYYAELELYAMTITAETAHDATGKAVPTSLSVSEGNVLILTVKHRTGGFVYPVVAGSTFQPSYETIVVPGPPTKQEEEAAEQKQREAESALNGPQIVAFVSAPQFAGCPGTGEACASSSAPYMTYAFQACSAAPLIGCSVWEEKIRGFFYFNGSQAWMSSRQPNCSHGAGPTFSVTEDYCKWVGPDHQPYGDGYHITSQVRFNVSALQVQTTSQKYLTVRMYGSGHAYVTPSSNICNPSRPSCA